MTAFRRAASLPTRLRAIVLIGALIGSLVVPAQHAAAQVGGAVRINEFLASNVNGIVDNTGEFEDWVELLNTSGAAVSLDGWTLQAGDDVYAFGPGESIAAGEYLVAFASGDATRSTPDELHLPFKLSAEGETLVLRDADGALTDPAWPAPGYPAQVGDDSFGVASGGQIRYFLTPTPGQPNGSGVAGRVEPVTFSVAHGYYDSDQDVVLDTATAGATIRYTLDGTTPTASVGTAIAPGNSISVTGTSIIRAVAYRSGWATSTVETRSYLFTDDIVGQSTATPSGWPADNTINGMRAFYGMEPGLSAAERAAVAEALTAIPAISLTTDLDNLFDPATGIWTNPRERGTDWEKPVAIELIDPTGAEAGFEINGGLRIRGNSSRSPRNFKHSMRLVFGDEYGDGELDYALFGNEGVDRFESVDLKTAQSWSWSNFNAAGVNRGTDATWLRDIWNRDTQGAMGHPYARSRYVHAFINGQYWGLYMTEERVSNQYAAQYTGGNEEDFDIIKRQTGDSALAGSLHVEARDGTLDDWLSLWPLVEDHELTDAEWLEFRDEVDLISLADFYVVLFYSGDSDSTPRYTKDRSNNWLAFRNRAGVGEAAKWQFNDRDSESALCTNVNAAREPDWDPTPPWNLDNGVDDYLPIENFLAPAWLFEAALTQPEFVRIFQDRVHHHLVEPDGALSVANSIARLEAREAVVDLAIDAEAARWGDTWVTPGFDRTNWETATDTVRDCFQLRRTVIEQYLRADGLWPVGDPPSINPAGGAVDFGSTVTITTDAGTIWVTTDGTDPLGPDDTPSPGATIYAGSITIDADVTIKARSVNGGEWSPLAEAEFTLSTPPDPPRLLLNEFNAVSSSNYLGGGLAADVANGNDSVLGRVAGNGGDWFELVVLEDRLDIRGWAVEVWDDDGGVQSRSARLVFGDDPALSSLRAGTLITVSEDIADDVSYAPQSGDWHINLQANDAGDGAFITTASQGDFAINNDDTRIALFDSAGQPEALLTGEGTVPGVSVGSTEVFKLEAAPRPSIGPDDVGYNDGTSSTWGQPNVFGGGDQVQDLTGLRLDFGDTNCDADAGIVDALLIAQFAADNRTDSPCPLADPATQLNVAAGDVNDDGRTDVVDGLLIAQCDVGIANSFCP